MSYASLGQTCSPPEVAYQGRCLSVAEQDEIGPSLCRADEYWVTSPSRGCRCRSGQRLSDGSCPAAQLSIPFVVAGSALVLGLAYVLGGA